MKVSLSTLPAAGGRRDAARCCRRAPRVLAARRRRGAARCAASCTSTPTGPMAPARPTAWRRRRRGPGSRSWSSPTTATRRVEPTAPVYRHGVLCIDAVEISTDARARAGAGAAARAVSARRRRRATCSRTSPASAAMSIVAHPTSARPSLRWTGGDAGFDGIEWLNGDSEWRDERLLALARVLLTYWFRPAESLASLLDRPVEALALWDRGGRTRARGRRGRRPMPTRASGFGTWASRTTAGRSHDLPATNQAFRTFSIAVPGAAPHGHGGRRRRGGARRDPGGSRGLGRSTRSPARPGWTSRHRAAGARWSRAAILRRERAVSRCAPRADVAGARLRADCATAREVGAASDGQGTAWSSCAAGAGDLPRRGHAAVGARPAAGPVAGVQSDLRRAGSRRRRGPSQPPARVASAPRAAVHDGTSRGWTIEHSARADGRVAVVKAVDRDAADRCASRSAAAATDRPFVALARPLEPSTARLRRAAVRSARVASDADLGAAARSRGAGRAGDGRDRSTWTRRMRRLTLPLREFLPAGHDSRAADARRDRLAALRDRPREHGARAERAGLARRRGAGRGVPPTARAPQVRTESRR